LYVQNKDTLTKRSNEAKLLELQTQYESSLKEKQIIELKHQQVINEITIKNSRQLLYISFGAVVIIGFLLLLVFRAFLSIKRKRDILGEKNSIIEQQNEEIRTQRDHLADSNIKIQLQHKQIEDSIDYARQIQESLFPSPATIKSVLGEYAMFYLPKDVVSGDFYWIHQASHYTYIAVGDCTGHGVPGAFMSVLSISLLNEIVKGKGIINPAGIMNEMRRLIMLSLKQDATRMGGTDGLELAICRIDRDTNKVVFAGAQRPLFLVREKSITEYPPNKMPISAHITMTDFTEIELDTKQEDVYYLLSDGYQDQFDKNNKQRYGKQRIKDLILKLHELPMQKQSKTLETEYFAWRGHTEQTDDVLILGFQT
jgi:serine phosphatase RsbU (regulator of sigma subunit)